MRARLRRARRSPVATVAPRHPRPRGRPPAAAPAASRAPTPPSGRRAAAGAADRAGRIRPRSAPAGADRRRRRRRPRRRLPRRQPPTPAQPASTLGSSRRSSRARRRDRAARAHGDEQRRADRQSEGRRSARPIDAVHDGEAERRRPTRPQDRAPPTPSPVRRRPAATATAARKLQPSGRQGSRRRRRKSGTGPSLDSAAMAESLASLYLIAGTDQAKIDATRARLRARAEGDGGAGGAGDLRAERGQGRARPRGAAGGDPGDVADRVAPLPARRRGRALARPPARARSPRRSATLPPDLTVVLIARAKAPAKLVKAVKAAKGEIHEFEAPKARDMPRVLVGDAKRLGFALEPGRRPHAGRAHGGQPGAPRATSWSAWRSGRARAGAVTAADLDAMVSDTSEAAVWALSDALLERDPAEAASHRRAADLPGRERHRPDLRPRLAPAQGLRGRRPDRGGRAAEAGRVEPRHAPLRGEAAGRPPRQDRASTSCSEATIALADLEVWCRGGADYGDELALTLALQASRGRCGLSYFAAAAAAMRAARDFLRAPVFLCRAPFCTALSILETSALVLGLDLARVAGLDRALEAAEIGLHRACEQPVLGALALAA